MDMIIELGLASEATKGEIAGLLTEQPVFLCPGTRSDGSDGTCVDDTPQP